MKSTAYALVAALGLGACVALPTQPEIQHAAATGGDFSLLSCDQLASAEVALRQRIGQPAGNGVYVFGVQTPDGTPVAQPKDLITSNALELERMRQARNCEPKKTAPATAAASAAPAPKPAKAAAPVTAEAPQRLRGRFLQVGTFSSVANVEATIAAFKSRGVVAVAHPTALNGREMHRVLVGPLRSKAEVARADRAAAELGLRDGFFIDG